VKITSRLLLVILAAALRTVFAADPSDVVLKAMRDELEHSKSLDAGNLGKPYFISYDVEEGEAFSASASMGGLIISNDTAFRLPRIQVRVGDYQFDNTNFEGSRSNRGSRYDIERFPIENLYSVLRRYLWLATDQSYKAAVESLASKRAALKNISAGESLPDFALAEPSRLIEDIPQSKLDRAVWLERARSLSAIFAEFPQVLESNVEVQAIKNIRRLVNSEGSEVRTADDVLFLRARVTGQAPDGMRLHDAVAVHARDSGRGLNETDLRREVRQVAESIAALTRAPVGDVYNGPVLFDGVAAAQLFAELLGRNLALTRRPVSEPGGRSANMPSSELEGRQGSRILPEWIDVIDDPTQQTLNGHRLFGSYWVDFEGVAGKRVVVVEKGVLKNFLLTRQPVTGFKESNGHARLPGPSGASAAGISNLFVRAAQSVPVADLKKQLLELCKARNLPYGIVVRKLDFPSSASIDELRRLVAANANEGSGSRLVSSPILIYKAYADGREELIRGVRFRELNVRSLRDIRSAGDDTTIFDYLNNGVPLALMGAGSYASETTVIAPSVLVDDLEVRKVDDELPRLPIVPPPLVAGK
jgi:predicted Zn-dependent protease